MADVFKQQKTFYFSRADFFEKLQMTNTADDSVSEQWQLFSKNSSILRWETKKESEMKRNLNDDKTEENFRRIFSPLSVGAIINGRCQQETKIGRRDRKEQEHAMARSELLAHNLCSPSGARSADGAGAGVDVLQHQHLPFHHCNFIFSLSVFPSPKLPEQNYAVLFWSHDSDCCSMAHMCFILT